VIRGRSLCARPDRHEGCGGTITLRKGGLRLEAGSLEPFVVEKRFSIKRDRELVATDQKSAADTVMSGGMMWNVIELPLYFAFRCIRSFKFRQQASPTVPT